MDEKLTATVAGDEIFEVIDSDGAFVGKIGLAIQS